MPDWRPVQTIDITELQELKEKLISIFFEGVPLGDGDAKPEEEEGEGEVKEEEN